MIALQLVDSYIGKHLLPKIKEEYFKNKIFVHMALAYLYLFPTARRHFTHFKKGSGEKQCLSTRQLLIKNPLVYSILKNKLFDTSGYPSGVIKIGQELLQHPDHRYALGCIDMHYEIAGEQLRITFHTNYHFDQYNQRLSRYLHEQLYTLEKNGRAKNFDIEGEPWKLSLHEFSSIHSTLKHRRRLNYNILYM